MKCKSLIRIFIERMGNYNSEAYYLAHSPVSSHKGDNVRPTSNSQQEIQGSEIKQQKKGFNRCEFTRFD